MNRHVPRRNFHRLAGPGVLVKFSATSATEKVGKPDPYDQLFRTYVETRKKCGESVQGLTLDSFRKTIANQVESIKKKTKAQGVKFQVATENGKTKLKAIPVTKK